MGFLDDKLPDQLSNLYGMNGSIRGQRGIKTHLACEVFFISYSFVSKYCFIKDPCYFFNVFLRDFWHGLGLDTFLSGCLCLPVLSDFLYDPPPLGLTVLQALGNATDLAARKNSPDKFIKFIFTVLVLRGRYFSLTCLNYATGTAQWNWLVIHHGVFPSLWGLTLLLRKSVIHRKRMHQLD